MVGGGPNVHGKDPVEKTMIDVRRLQSPRERNIRNPVNRIIKDMKRPSGFLERSVLEDKHVGHRVTRLCIFKINELVRPRMVGSRLDEESPTWP